jgi:triosephosphate isomerase
MSDLTSPFFEIGSKNLLRYEQLRALAAAAAAASAAEQISVILTVPALVLSAIKAEHPDLLVFAQSMDPHGMGASVGKITAEALVDAGADGVMLNHSACPADASLVGELVQRAASNGLLTMVCASHQQEAVDIAHLKPDILLYEPPELIGHPGGSPRPWIAEINAQLLRIDADLKVMHAGGIGTPDDAYRVMFDGAAGTGCTTGVVLAANPSLAAHRFIAAARRGWDASHGVTPSNLTGTRLGSFG